MNRARTKQRCLRAVEIRRAHVLSGFLSLVLVSAPLLAGCNTIELDSQWCDHDVVIDGADNPESEWQGARTYIEDEGVAIGLLNDNDYLYVSLVAADRMSLMHFTHSGLTLWFDAGGEEKKHFGIRFPLGGEGAGPPMTPRGSQGDPGEMQRKTEELLKSMKQLEILGPREDEIRRTAIAEVKGIEVSVGASNEAFQYELKVPLVQSAEHPYAIGAEGGGLVAIGFDSPQIDMEKMRERMGGRGGGMGGPGGIGGRGGGGPGGMGGRGGMGGGGGMGGARPKMPEPLDVWIVAKLASAGESVAKSD